MPWPWESTTGTDSSDATDVENSNNAEYARGEEAGRTGDFIQDAIHDTVGEAHGSDQYNKGYKEGRNNRS